MFVIDLIYAIAGGRCGIGLELDPPMLHFPLKTTSVPVAAEFDVVDGYDDKVTGSRWNLGVTTRTEIPLGRLVRLHESDLGNRLGDGIDPFLGQLRLPRVRN